MDGSISFAVAFAAGVISFLSPCVLPIVPGYLGFITGMSLDELQAAPSRRAVLVPALFFVAGFSLIFLILGASATLIGQVFKVYQDWIARVGGLLIIVFGLHLLGVLRFGALMRERRLHLARSPAGYAGAVVTGAAFGAGWTPCLGPVLGALLTYASARATLADGMLLLGSYSLGLAVPFLMAAAATGFFLNASKRLRGAMPIIEKASGVVLVFVGLLLVSGTFTVLSGWLTRFTPAFILDSL
ncbi:MAG TPA: cytochrome c biogenesis protein CcdA [Longimicrobiales bacterium]|nr:cytochrome c biogenesis protein CcdA [Longimicrobiales bacterium]